MSVSRWRNHRSRASGRCCSWLSVKREDHSNRSAEETVPMFEWSPPSATDWLEEHGTSLAHYETRPAGPGRAPPCRADEYVGYPRTAALPASGRHRVHTDVAPDRSLHVMRPPRADR